jgi:uncharacterized protein (TIGR02646 family)
MLELPNTPLDASALAQLTSYQNEIDALPDYAERVMAAQRKFKSANTKRNRTFCTVRTALDALCSGARRCMYCEDSCATDIEHHRPKDLYPELTFVWENYLYACSRCNRPKSTQFEIFSARTGQRVHVSRSRNAPVMPPEPGDPLLIDPRSENPMDYLALDLTATFLFIPRGQASSVQNQRARYTLKVLTLNEEPLPQARKNAYHHYLNHLHRYASLRNTENAGHAQERIVETIRSMEHPTVWLEMKRQHQRINELHSLFEVAPEALHW